mgnify:FL=1|tara:strand:+ start:2700 stop:3284 length:585 start_codon:yes stop_codon:yes gene_type:complete
MSSSKTHVATTQNQLLLDNLMEFYENKDYLKQMMNIINGESNISLRIIDWFVTNFAKKNFTVYEILTKTTLDGEPERKRFKVYNDYKLKLKAYSKRKFDPFCRWERISIPYDYNIVMETTIGQLNFFKWAIENKIIDYIRENYQAIESDMNTRNNTYKNQGKQDSKTRKKREELSIYACKCIKKESVEIVVKFN